MGFFTLRLSFPGFFDNNNNDNDNDDNVLTSVII